MKTNSIFIQLKKSISGDWSSEDAAVDILMIEPAKSGFEADAFRVPMLLDNGDSESEYGIVAVGLGTIRRKSPREGREWMRDWQ